MSDFLRKEDIYCRVKRMDIYVSNVGCGFEVVLAHTTRRHTMPMVIGKAGIQSWFEHAEAAQDFAEMLRQAVDHEAVIRYLKLNHFGDPLHAYSEGGCVTFNDPSGAIDIVIKSAIATANEKKEQRKAEARARAQERKIKKRIQSGKLYNAENMTSAYSSKVWQG